MTKREKEFWSDLGHSIYEARYKRDMSQEQLAKKLKLSRVSVVNIENGRHRISAYRMCQIERILCATFRVYI